MQKSHVVIMAAGKGTRMRSELPKVLHVLSDKTLIEHVLTQVMPIDPRPSIVVGHGTDMIKEKIGDDFDYVQQTEQRGTGHAIMCAREDLQTKDIAIIVTIAGDQPLVRRETIEQLIATHEATGATISLCSVVSPHFEDIFQTFLHYSRIMRNSAGEFEKIVEYKDASPAERETKEVGISCLCFNARWLWDNILELKNENAAGEYYLTDLINVTNAQGKKVHVFQVENYTEGLGVNTPEELARLAQLLQ